MLCVNALVKTGLLYSGDGIILCVGIKLFAVVLQSLVFVSRDFNLFQCGHSVRLFFVLFF